MKHFIKPSWIKILLTVIPLLASFFNVNRINAPDVLMEKYGLPLPYLRYVASIFEGESYNWLPFNLLLDVIIWYLFSCFVVWAFGKFRRKTQ